MGNNLGFGDSPNINGRKQAELGPRQAPRSVSMGKYNFKFREKMFLLFFVSPPWHKKWNKLIFLLSWPEGAKRSRGPNLHMWNIEAAGEGQCGWNVRVSSVSILLRCFHLPFGTFHHQRSRQAVSILNARSGWMWKNANPLARWNGEIKTPDQ